jgi:hypothetical protein
LLFQLLFTKRLANYEIQAIVLPITLRIVCRQQRGRKGKENVTIRPQGGKAVDSIGDQTVT